MKHKIYLLKKCFFLVFLMLFCTILDTMLCTSIKIQDNFNSFKTGELRNRNSLIRKLLHKTFEKKNNFLQNDFKYKDALITNIAPSFRQIEHNISM